MRSDVPADGRARDARPRPRARPGLRALTATIAVACALLAGCSSGPLDRQASRGATGATGATASGTSAPTGGRTEAPSSTGTAGTPGKRGGVQSHLPAVDPVSGVVDGTDHGVSANGYVYPAARVHDWYLNGPRSADYPSRRIVFLTFDDGPTNVTTPRVLGVLHKYGVHATFFDIGKQVPQTNPAVLRLAIAQGNGICVHSYSHDYHYLYPHRVADTAHIVADYTRGLAALRAVLGPGLFCHAIRYPGGHMSWHGMTGPHGPDAALAARGVTYIDWNSLTGDADRPLPRTESQELRRLGQTIALNHFNHVQVVLMHDTYGKELTIRSLLAIITYFKRNDYQFGIMD